MKRLILLMLPIVLCCACAEFDNNKRYKEYVGIDYSAYELPQAYTEVNIDSMEEIVPDNTDTSDVVEITEEEIIESSNQAYGEAVVVMSSKKIPLSKNATDADLMIFQNALDNSYQAVLKTYRTQGFTYTLAPAGTVNPLSVMNVQCLLSENFANTSGKKVCDAFFARIPVEYSNEKMKKAEENVKNI